MYFGKRTDCSSLFRKLALAGFLSAGFYSAAGINDSSYDVSHIPDPHDKIVAVMKGEMDKGVDERNFRYGPLYIWWNYDLDRLNKAWCAKSASFAVHQGTSEYPLGAENSFQYSRNIKKEAIKHHGWYSNTSQNRELIKPGYLVMYTWDHEDRHEKLAEDWEEDGIDVASEEYLPLWVNHTEVVTGVYDWGITTISGNVHPHLGEVSPHRVGSVKGYYSEREITWDDPTLNGFANPLAHRENSLGPQIQTASHDVAAQFEPY